MHKKFTKNVAVLVALLLMVSLVGSGCDKGSVQESTVNDFIDSRVNDTLVAMDKRDVELARDIWSDLTELSVSLEKNEEMSTQVAALALSYEKLIAYCNTGKEEDLKLFKDEFKTAAEGLKELLLNENYDCSNIEKTLAKAYA